LNEFVDAPHCTLNQFAQDYRHTHVTAPDPVLENHKEKLIAHAIHQATCIGTTESGHGANRRREKQTGTQGSRNSIEDLSADEQIRWLRQEAANVDFLYKVLDVEADKNEECGPVRARRTGGRRMVKIWAWRVFCAEHRAQLAADGDRDGYKTKALGFVVCDVLGR